MSTVPRMPWAETKMPPILEPSGLFVFLVAGSGFCCCLLAFVKGYHLPSQTSRKTLEESLKSAASQCPHLVPISEQVSLELQTKPKSPKGEHGSASTSLCTVQPSSSPATSASATVQFALVTDADD